MASTTQDPPKGAPGPDGPVVLPPKVKPNARADIVLGCVVAIAAVALFQQTFGWRPSAAVLPRIVAGLLFLLGIVNALQGVRRLKSDPGDPFLPDVRGFATVWLAILLYFAAVLLIGFALATVLLTMGLAYAFGFRRPLRSAFAGAVFVAITVLVFSGIFNRPLPEGLLVQWITG